MKRFILIVVCFSIFHATAIWAIQGCTDIGPDHDLHQDAKSAVHDHQHASRHTHSSPSEIHCPNIFGEFLISSRVILSSDNGHGYVAVGNTQTVDALLSGSITLAEGGPPGLIQSKIFPRHLLLSVIRI